MTDEIRGVEEHNDDPPERRDGTGRRKRWDHLIPLLIAAVLVVILVGGVLSVVILHEVNQTKTNAKHLTAVERQQRITTARIDRAAARRELARSTRSTAFSFCKRQNRMTRAMNNGWEKLAGLIKHGESQIQQFVVDGTLTPEQAARSLASAESQIHTVLNLRISTFDCSKVKARIPVR